jgi:hypothetical protein
MDAAGADKWTGRMAFSFSGKTLTHLKTLKPSPGFHEASVGLVTSFLISSLCCRSSLIVRSSSIGTTNIRALLCSV